MTGGIFNLGVASLLKLKNSDTVKDEETIIIFDWDDTLYPTTWIKSNMDLIRNPLCADENILNIFKQLSDQIIYIITKAQIYGKVFIITNAFETWIKDSCKLIPEVIPFLKNINIISAQDKWKSINPNPGKWKELEFEQIALNFIKSNIKIIKFICIGDSHHEHNAIINAASIINASKVNVAYTKNFVFRIQPTFEQILIQINNMAHYLHNNKDNIITDMESHTIQIPFEI